MRIDVLRPASLTPDLLDRWHRLQDEVPSLDSPLLTPEFARAARAAGENVEVAVIDRGGEASGFFAYQREHGRTGRPVAWRVSDLQGLVARPSLPVDPLDLLKAVGLSVWHFDHLIADRPDFAPYHTRLDPSPYMDVSAGYDAYRSARRASGSRLIAQAERKARRLCREMGPLRFELHVDDDRVFEALERWKRRQLAEHDYTDVFSLPTVTGLLGRIRRMRSHHCQGVLSALWAGDQLAAVHLGLRRGPVLTSCIPTFDPSLARHSPGLLLHLELARAGAGAGIRRIDLGRGLNQLKIGLMSGATAVAIGAIDRRPLPRAARALWWRTRDVAYSTPLRGAPLRAYRRVRNRLVALHVR